MPEPLELDMPAMDGLTAGELRILSKETGTTLRHVKSVAQLIAKSAKAWDSDDEKLGEQLDEQIMTSGVDEADLIYALSRIAAVRAGYDDDPAIVDRVTFTSAGTEGKD